jgi:hypothetical protein
MKKNLKFLIFGVIFVLLSGCTDDNTTQPPNDPVNNAGTTQTITSETSGTLEWDGFRMEVHTGNVPRMQNGNPGTVTFSLNSSSTIENGFSPVPSQFTVISKYLKAGPEAFNFAGTIQLFFPAESQPNPQDLTVLEYRPDTQEWKIVPTSAIDTANKKIGVDVLKLGYYVLAKHNLVDNLTDFRAGGCVLDIPMEPFTNYILTCQSVSPEKPSILNFYSGGLVGKTFMGPIFLGCQQNKTKAIVPQGTISFWVSKISCQGSNPEIFTYSIPASVTINDPLEFVGWSTYDAVVYVPFTLPTGGSWVSGRPTNWPPPTQPFGTGTVQATLTWNNTTSNGTDLDLHLYGPNNLHISWQNTSSANFTLDRDWRTTAGDAIENIFSTTTTVPSGDYRVNVAHFQGFSKTFNCRVIVNGSVTNYTNTLGGGSVDVRTFNIP